MITGYYLYIETSTGLIGNKAILISPQFQQAYSTCQLKFSYHMYGSTIGSLTVYLNDGVSRTRMWSLTGLYTLISFHWMVLLSLAARYARLPAAIPERNPRKRNVVQTRKVAEIEPRYQGLFILGLQVFFSLKL